MTEKPILFSTSMVQALLRAEGPKTQTRRVAKIGHVGVVTDRGDGKFQAERVGCGHTTGWEIIRCPYGAPGDRLWVRESFNFSHESHLLPGENSRYCPERVGFLARHLVWRADGERTHPTLGKALWLPSIHMPRWASRITLEITGVRLERLRRISVEDMIAEGLSTHLREHDAVCDLREQWQRRWDALNGKREGYSWSDDPYVWALTFRRLTP